MALLVLLVSLALVAACAGPDPSPRDSASPTAPQPTSPGASADTRPDASPDPTTPPAAWTALDIAPLPVVATLEPTKAGRAGVAVDTAFRLTSLDGRAASTLAKGIVATPPLAFTVASTEGSMATLRPTAPLRAGTTYRISLARTDGTIEGSWAAVAAAPLAVSDTVPGNQSTGVPRDTGIEITFNQYGVTTTDLARFFTISPRTSGAFNAAGRTIAFVPASPLAKARVYTVTIRHGLPLAGTGQVLREDVVVRFETKGGPVSRVFVGFRHEVVDGNPREATAATVTVDRDEVGAVPTSIPVTIHRLAGMDDALAAYRVIRTAPTWTIESSARPVRTSGLARVFSGSLRLRRAGGDVTWIQLPVQRAGWYVVTETFGGRPRQMVLQVTDVATFALAGGDRTAVWVNDIRTGGPAAGASVALDGRRMGATDERGLLLARTPAALNGEDTTGEAILVVRSAGRTAFLPITRSLVCEACWYDDQGNDDWWRLFATDRQQYRSTDTLNAWGMVRDRTTGDVPGIVTLELRAERGDMETAPPIATATAEPDASGAFTAAIPFEGLPIGSYRLRLRSGSASLGDTWLAVATIVKPAYQLALETDRHAVLIGETVKATAAATFFEGTPVAGTALSLSTEEGASVLASTDTGGSATAIVTVAPQTDDWQWTIAMVNARPQRAEEAEITAQAPVAVFRSTAIVDATSTLAGTRLTLSGAVSDVVFDRFEHGATSLWEVDPRGATRPGARVHVVIVERTPVRRQTGTTYDFISKRTTPVYEYDDRNATILDRTMTAGADGTFRLALDVKGGRRSYAIAATYTDEGGRRTTATASADSTWNAWDDRWAHLEREDSSAGEGYSVGDTVRVRLTGGSADSDASRYLFAVTHAGLRYVTTGSSPTFRTTFDASWIPGMTISGVRFTGTTYETSINGYDAGFRAADRTMRIELSADQARYAPGETATVTVRTTHANGQPVAASVMVRVVDQKLYAIEAAADADSLAQLYAPLNPGIRAWASSHRTPMDDEGWGKGDTTGGGGDGRSDFRDWLVARLVRTGADGVGTITVPLSDDLTSWHVAASGVTRSLEAGDASLLLPVGLPFFVEATIAPEYVIADRPIIRVRGFGGGVGATDEVTFQVSSDTLPMTERTVSAMAFGAADVALPDLTIGVHRIRIQAKVTSGGVIRTDTLTRTFSVVETRARQSRTTWSALDSARGVDAGMGLTSVLLVDSGRGRVIPVLQELAWGGGGRADERIAGALAHRVLDVQFGLADGPAIDDGGLTPFVRDSGVGLLPYASPQLEITALAAMAGDPRIGGEAVHGFLWEIAASTGEPRDRRLLALAGLAGMGDPVLPDVREAAAETDLTPPEQISLAIAALYAGDEALAARLERALLDGYGDRQGGWVRVKVGSAEEWPMQTARLAIVAASLGDPLAADMDAWVAANPSRITSLNLERALAARGWASRVAGAPARAAVTVDGVRRVVAIAPGQPVLVPMTPTQATTAIIEPVEGSVLLVQTWDDRLDATSLQPAKGQTLERTVTPAGVIGETDTVVVRLLVTLGPDARDECWRVTDIVPSGLAPIRDGVAWDEEGGYVWSSASPDEVHGQRVAFCAYRDPLKPTLTLTYRARVVTPGEYAWEPAVLQSERVPDQGVVLAPATITIRGASE